MQIAPCLLNHANLEAPSYASKGIFWRQKDISLAAIALSNLFVGGTINNAAFYRSPSIYYVLTAIAFLKDKKYGLWCILCSEIAKTYFVRSFQISKASQHPMSKVEDDILIDTKVCRQKQNMLKGTSKIPKH